MTSEAVKSVLDNQNEEEAWGSDAFDILLQTWNVIMWGIVIDLDEQESSPPLVDVWCI